MVKTRIASLLVASGLAASAASADVQFIDFDDVAVPPGIHVVSGDSWLSQGVSFSTVTIPDAVSVGDVISPTNISSDLWLYSASWSTSIPNCIAAEQGGLRDVLMTFTLPVFRVSLHSDHYNEIAVDPIRLIALIDTGNGLEVVDTFDATDFEVATPADHLEVSSAQPFTHAIFQTITEQEGFDNLEFEQVVIPAPGAAGCLTLAGLALARRRRRSA